MHANNVYLHNNVLCMLRQRYGLVIDENMCRPMTVDSISIVLHWSVLREPRALSPESRCSAGPPPPLMTDAYKWKMCSTRHGRADGNTRPTG